MGQDLQIPSEFKNGPGAAWAGLNPADDQLSSGLGRSFGVIGYKGRAWSIRYRGEVKTVVRPDDGTQSGHLDVVILGQAPNKSKVYYKAFDAATAEGDRPLCSSMDGIVPDADVLQKQHPNCALCPKNKWETNPQTGRKGKACRDFKRLAVLVWPTQTTPLFGPGLMEPMFLRVPPDSLNSLAIMGDTMSRQGYHYSTYITRITFDPQKAHPSMVFKPIPGLTEKDAPVIMELRKDPTVDRITVGDAASAGMHGVNQALQSPSVTGLIASTPPAPLSNGGHTLGTPTSGVSTVSSPPQPKPGPQTVADVGLAVDTDDDLDARIAGLISRG